MGGFVEEPVRVVEKAWKGGKRVEKQIFGKVSKERKRTERTILAPFKKQPFLTFPATATTTDPAPTTVLAGERAESIADRLKKRKRYRTAMGGGYGELSLSQAGLLGV